jgi:hypothetical protein
MSPRKVLISRPRHDEPTDYLYTYANEVVEYANSNGITTLDFAEKKSNKKDIQKVLKKQKPKFAFFNGHGNDKTIMGHNNEALIRMGGDEELLKSKIVYSLACNSAKELGRSCVKKGTNAYVGYEDNYIFARDSNKTCRPLDDELAYPCLFSSITIPFEILKGKTVREAYDKSMKQIDEFVKNLSHSGAPLGAENAIMALLWNKTQLALLGDNEASF